MNVNFKLKWVLNPELGAAVLIIVLFSVMDWFPKGGLQWVLPVFIIAGAFGIGEFVRRKLGKATLFSMD